MCGIVYTKRLDGKVAHKQVIKRYEAQADRGSDGFGYVSLTDGLVSDYARATTEEAIMDRMEKDKSSEILFHHRLPTSTPNFAETAHPILISNKLLKCDYYVIHNGIISDDKELKAKHEKMGFAYNTEVVQKWRQGENIISKSKMWNDSEALAIELALAIEAEAPKLDITGSIAFIALQVEKNTRKAKKLYYGRNASNPLKLDIQKKQFFVLASEGSGQDISTDTLYSFDYDTFKIDERAFVIGKSYFAERWGYNTDNWYDAGGKYTDSYKATDQEQYYTLLEHKYYLEEKIALAQCDDEDLAEMQEDLDEVEDEIADYEADELQTALKMPF